MPPLTDPRDLAGCVLWLDAAQDEVAGGGSPTLDPSDDFLRLSAVALGVADSGHWWEESGGWAISSTGKAYVPSGAPAAVAVVESLVADGTVSVKLDQADLTNGNGGLVFRYSDATNFWRFMADTFSGQLYLQKNVGGVNTNVWNGSAFAAADVLAVVLAGNNITLKRNGITLTTITDAFNATATKHGMWSNFGSGNYRMDLFRGPAYTLPTLADGDFVARWTDRSGASHPGVMTRAGRRPKWRTNVQNGLSMVEFGIDSPYELLTIARLPFNMEAGTTFVVAKPRSGASPSADGTACVLTAYEPNALAQADVTLPRWYVLVDLYSWVPVVGNASGATALTDVTKSRVIGMRGDGGDARRSISCVDDTTDTNTVTGSTRSGYAALGCLFTDWTKDTRQHFDGFIGEVIHYDRALTDPEWDDVTAYLKAKWGLRCPSFPRVKVRSRGDALPRVGKHGSRSTAPARIRTYV